MEPQVLVEYLVKEFQKQNLISNLVNVIKMDLKYYILSPQDPDPPEPDPPDPNEKG